MGESNVFDRLMEFSATSVGIEKPENTQKKVKVSDKFLMKIKDLGFSMDQLEPALKQKGNQLILSCAGSGKTTTLVFKIIYNLLTGETTRVVEVNGSKIRVPARIWVSTFLRSGAKELESRMSYWQRAVGVMDTASSVMFSTIHAEFKRALNAYGVETNLISDKENMSLLREVANSYAVRNDRGKPLNNENLRDLSSALTYTRNRIDGRRYDKSVYDDFNLTAKIIDSMLRDWKTKRYQKGMVDFEDLQEELFDSCYIRKDKTLIKFLSDRYDYIYLDEFQDISQIQYEVLKIYASGIKKIVAIGDDDQTIYSWRGSCNDIITKRFIDDFAPTVNELSLNFRCPENILNAIIPSIERNQSRYKKSLKAYKEGGVLRVGAFMNYMGMADALIDNVYTDLSKGMTVAVLCRVNSDGLLPAMMLDRARKFDFNISGEGMTLDSYVGRMVVGIVRMFTESYSSSVENSLNMLTWDKYQVSKLITVCKNNRTNIWEISDKDFSYSCPGLFSVVDEWRKIRKNEGDVAALLNAFSYYRTDVFMKQTNFNVVARSVISAMESMLVSGNYKSVVEFLEDIEEINDRLKARRNDKYINKVRIATVHEFKGKEADSVYIWNDTVDVYPQKDAACVPEDYEEERRVHYIACTRAKKMSTIMYLSGHAGDFVNEMDLSKAENIGVGSMAGKLPSRKGVFKVPSEERNMRKAEEIMKLRNKESNPDMEYNTSSYFVDDEGYQTIVELHLEGLTPEEISETLVENMCDLYTLEQIRSVVDRYERNKKWGRY